MVFNRKFDKLKKFLKIHKLKSNDLKIILHGLTHSSFTHDNEMAYACNYERLEFLGDAVLKIIASKYLFDKYPDYNEGQLTQIRSIIVSDVFLAQLAGNINLEDFLRLGVDFNNAQAIPSSIIACAYEGLLGALYLTADFKSITNFLVRQFEGAIDDVVENTSFYNAKARLQEYTQSRYKALPKYTVKCEHGPEHDKTFEIEVSYNEESTAVGTGKTKKEAQQNAAMAACKQLGILKNEQNG